MSPRLLGGAFGLLAFAITFETATDLIPAWGQKYAALRVPSAVRDQMMQSQAPVVSCGQDWGSVPFYLHRNDIQNVDSRSMDQLAQRVGHHGGTFLILDHTIALNTVRQALPPEIAIDPLSVTLKSTVVFLHFVDDQTRLPAAGWSKNSNEAQTLPRSRRE